MPSPPSPSPPGTTPSPEEAGEPESSGLPIVAIAAGGGVGGLLLLILIAVIVFFCCCKKGRSADKAPKFTDREEGYTPAYAPNNYDQCTVQCDTGARRTDEIHIRNSEMGRRDVLMGAAGGGPSPNDRSARRQERRLGGGASGMVRSASGNLRAQIGDSHAGTSTGGDVPALGRMPSKEETKKMTGASTHDMNSSLKNSGKSQFITAHI